jgi:hypothetical protein
MCHGPNHHFQYGWIVSRLKLSASTWLECVMVQIVSFNIAEMCGGQNCQFQHEWNVSWSKSSVLAFLECVVVTNSQN